LDATDKAIANILQINGRASNSEIADALGIAVSTASERVRKLVSDGIIKTWQGVLEPSAFNIDVLAFIFLDTSYQGEAEACKAIVLRPEVQEVHHVSGKHSYLIKVRVKNTSALQTFLQEHIKPIAAVTKTETIFVMDTIKETSALAISTLPITEKAK
jgi:Lrp/AsnC family leucine-responsive transcriptional regulator